MTFWSVRRLIDHRENIRPDGNIRPCVDRLGLRWRGLLRDGHDERRARKRFKIGNQRVRSHELSNIEVLRHGQRGCARRNIEHLTGGYLAPVARLFLQGNTGRSLQRVEFIPASPATLENHRGAGYRHRDRAASDRPAAGILRDAQQNRAALDVRGPARFVKTEDRVCAQTRDGQIREGQFRTRFAAGAHPGVFGNLVVQGGLARGSIRREKFYFVDDLGDSRLFGTGGVGGRARQDKRSGGDRTEQDFGYGFHRAN